MPTTPKINPVGQTTSLAFVKAESRKALRLFFTVPVAVSREIKRQAITPIPDESIKAVAIDGVKRFLGPVTAVAKAFWKEARS